MTDMNNSLSKSASVLGWDLMHEVYAKKTRSTALSPLSVSFALGMLAGGATGSAQKDLCSKLGISDAATLKGVFSALLEAFSTGSNREMLAFANAVFADRSFTINPGYLKHVDAFRAYVKSDLPSLVEAKDQINGWISDNTNGMIKDMLTAGNLSPSHVALVNALAFKGVWKNKFDPKLTRKNYPFRLSSGKAILTDMMFQHGLSVLLCKGSDYTAVQLPYTASSAASTMSFIAYLPDEKSTLPKLLNQLRHQDVPVFLPTRLTQLGLPKLDVTTAVDIFPLLEDLKYLSASNFPEIGSGPNVVGSILHNAAVKLDERGTEAAAATVVLMRRSAGPSQAPIVVFDRPFAFSIVVNASGLTVFCGVFTGE
jgi:serine protease inhibitor